MNASEPAVTDHGIWPLCPQVGLKLKQGLVSAFTGGFTLGAAPGTAASPAALGEAPDADTDAGGGKAGPDVAAGFSKLAGNFSSWWSTIDSNITGDVSTSSATLGHAAKLAITSDLSFPVGEHLLEAFCCSLEQAYRCPHNDFTPPIHKSYSGVLAVTNRNLHFRFLDGQPAPVQASTPAAAN